MTDDGAAERADVEQLADAMLDAVEANAEAPDSGTETASEPDVFAMASRVLRELGGEFVRRYNRLEVEVEAAKLHEPVLFVANHGFGALFDLNILATGAALEELNLDREVTVLMHQMTWTLRLGAFVEPFGARPASHTSAHEAFEAGRHVLVLPGGDLEAFKAWPDRDRVMFNGRSGFARLAMDAGRPIVPIVTAGAGESVLALANGERLARAMKLDKLLRLKALPVTVSLPWGVTVGGAGFLPYLPLPTKLLTRVLPAMVAGESETAEEYALRVEVQMQAALTDMTEGRRPLLG